MKRAYPPVSLRLQVAQASGVELAGLLAHRVSAQIERGIDVDGSYRAAGRPAAVLIGCAQAQPEPSSMLGFSG